MDEAFLSSKLSVLQTEMLNFHKKISPVKRNHSQSGSALMLTYPEESSVLSSCISVLLAVLKISVCITGPTLFPTIIYCIEGSSQLFWQVTAISCVIAILLTMMAISMLCTSIERIRDTFSQLLNSAGDFLWKIPMVRCLYDVTSSDFAKKHSEKLLYPLVVLFSTSLVTLVACVKNLPAVFYGSLMVISFVSGILSTNVVHILRSPDILPFRSPFDVQMQFTTPSPQTKKGLDLPLLEKPQASSATRSSPLSDIDYDYIETQSITAFLPNLQTDTYDSIETTHYLQLPFNLKFFRR